MSLFTAILWVGGVVVVLLALLVVNSFRLANARLRIIDLESAYPIWRQAHEQRQNELAHVKALRDKVAETELITRLSLEMGFTDEEDDTLPMVEELP